MMSIRLIAERSNLPPKDVRLKLGVIDQTGHLFFIEQVGDLAKRLTGYSHGRSPTTEMLEGGMNLPTGESYVSP